MIHSVLETPTGTRNREKTLQGVRGDLVTSTFPPPYNLSYQQNANNIIFILLFFILKGKIFQTSLEQKDEKLHMRKYFLDQGSVDTTLESHPARPC